MRGGSINNSYWLKVSILSVSLLTVFGSAAVAPALSEIAMAFPDVSLTKIKTLLTAPAIAVLFLAPCMGWLSRKVGQRQLLIMGLCVYCVSGVGAGFANSFEALFASRVVLGLSLAILMPLSQGLIANYFDGRERLQMMGYSTSVSSFFGVCASIGVGYLALISWRYGFVVYAISLLSLVLVLINVPKEQHVVKHDKASSQLPLSVYGWSASIFLLMISLYAVPVNIALFMAESGIGGAKETGLAVSCLTVSSFIAGIAGATLRAAMGRFFVFGMLLLAALGYFYLLQAHSLVTVMAGVMAIGLGCGFIMPYLFFCATNAAQKGNAVAAMGVVAGALSSGQFITPLLLDSAARLAKGSDWLQHLPWVIDYHLFAGTAIAFMFACIGVALVLIAVAALLRSLLRPASEAELL